MQAAPGASRRRPAPRPPVCGASLCAQQQSGDAADHERALGRALAAGSSQPVVDNRSTRDDADDANSDSIHPDRRAPGGDRDGREPGRGTGRSRMPADAPWWKRCDVAVILGGKARLGHRAACDAGKVVLRRLLLGIFFDCARMVVEHGVLSACRALACPVRRALGAHGGADSAPAAFYVIAWSSGTSAAIPAPPGSPRRPGRGHRRGARRRARRSGRPLRPAEVGLENFGWWWFMERAAPLVGAWEAFSGSAPGARRVARRARGRQRAAGDRRWRCTGLTTPCWTRRRGPDRGCARRTLSMLGDPSTDLGVLLAFWSQEADDAVLAAARIVARHLRRGLPRPARRRSSAMPDSTGFDAHGRADRDEAFALRACCPPGIAGAPPAGAMLGLGLRRRAAPRRPAGRRGPRRPGAARASAVKRQMDSGRSRSWRALREWWWGRSLDRHPAVDAEHVARPRSCCPRQQEEHCSAELTGTPAVAQRRAPAGKPARPWLSPACWPLGGRRRRAHPCFTVLAHAHREAQPARQADDAGLPG